jgi:hypothetical protein
MLTGCDVNNVKLMRQTALARQEADGFCAVLTFLLSRPAGISQSKGIDYLDGR